MLFVTSDRHFLHKNMTQEGSDLVGRGFNNIEEMTKYLIDTHNNFVGKKDTTIDLGDLSLHGDPAQVFDIYSQMNGNFIIVRGNHDDNKLIRYFEMNNFMYYGKPKFEFHDVGYRMKKDKKTLYFTHYPMQVGDGGKVFNIHGHIHANASPFNFGINVGIDSPEVRGVFGSPQSLEIVLELLVEKTENAKLTNI